MFFKHYALVLQRYLLHIHHVKNSTIETVINQNEMGEKNKSTNIIEKKKKINSKDKNVPKTQNKKKKISGEQSEKESETNMY